MNDSDTNKAIDILNNIMEVELAGVGGDEGPPTDAAEDPHFGGMVPFTPEMMAAAQEPEGAQVQVDPNLAPDAPDELKNHAVQSALKLGCGHSFIIYVRNAYPINVLDKIKKVSEVCCIYAATANPLQVLVCETDQGKGIIGVVDGSHSKGIETESEANSRREFLRKIGYKR